MKVKIRKRKPLKGGEAMEELNSTVSGAPSPTTDTIPTAPSDPTVLLIADSYHDFWNCSRGQFEAEPRLTAILNLGLLEATIATTKIGFSTLPKVAYTPVEGARAIIAQYPDYNNLANQLFAVMSPTNKILVANIEETTAKAYLTPPPTFDLDVEDKDLKDGNNDLFNKVVQTVIGPSYVEADDIHILCDAGFGNIAKLGKKSDRLRGIITPQVIGDSANTSLKPIGSKSNIFFAPENDSSYSNYFISDSNTFTKNNGYTVFYQNLGLNDNNPYNFTLGIIHNGTPIETKFSPKTNTGPSAALLGGCYVAKRLSTGTQEEQVYDQTKVYPDLLRRLAGSGGKSFRATSNIVDIWSAFKDVPDPNIFIDLKRGGDRDQVMAAVIASSKFNNVIFCTGDLLCAVTAIRMGLPTILQLPRTSGRKAKITGWAKGVGQVGGSKKNIYHGGGEYDKTEEELLIEETNLTVEDMLRDAAAQAAAFIKTTISNEYPAVNQLCVITNVVHEINILLQKLSKMSSKQLEEILQNFKIFEPVNLAINNYNLSLKSYTNKASVPSEVLPITQVVGRGDKLRYIVSIQEIQTQTQAYIADFTKRYLDKANQLLTPAEIGKQTVLRQQLLTYNSQPINEDIMSFLTDKYGGNKFPVGSNERNLYSAIETLLFPYNSDGKIKEGYFNEAITRQKMIDKNLFVVGLITLTLINDMIDLAINNKTSVATSILYGVNYDISNVLPLNDVTINYYVRLLESITRAILVSAPGNPLVPKEVFSLATSGGKKRHKTIKHRKYRLKKRLLKTQHKRKSFN